MKKSENGIRELHFQMNERSAFPLQFSCPLCHSTLGETKKKNAKLGNGVLKFIHKKPNLVKSLIFFYCFIVAEITRRMKDNWRCHFKEKMSQEEAHHHRKPWIRSWR